MTEFISVATAHFLALISPGPDFFIIVSIAMRSGSWKAAWTCLGIAAANGVYILFALIGFTIVREHSWLLNTIKICGAFFLCYLGFMLLRSGKRELFDDKAGEQTEMSVFRLFITGFMSAILNPKNQIFYITLYSLFISRTTLMNTQVLYGFWMFSIVLLWDLLIAFTVGNKRIRRLLNNYTYKIEKLSGAVIMALGVVIIFQ